MGRVTVQARVNRLGTKHGGLLVRGAAKSDAGERTTRVAPLEVDALRKLRRHVLEARLYVGTE